MGSGYDSYGGVLGVGTMTETRSEVQVPVKREDCQLNTLGAGIMYVFMIVIVVGTIIALRAPRD